MLLGQAAGSAFNILFKGGAGSAVDSVIPALLAGLEGDSKQASQALEGLRVILGVRPQTLSSMVRCSPRLQDCASSCRTSCGHFVQTVYSHDFYILVQVPKLLKPPLHATALQAIGSLAEVAGSQPLP